MESSKLVLEAIALRKCIEATYNRAAVKLAPHILYTKHGELFIDAVTAEREGSPPKETKLGTFKLAGQTIQVIISRSFHPEPVFNSPDPKYAVASLFAVEAG